VYFDLILSDEDLFRSSFYNLSSVPTCDSSSFGRRYVLFEVFTAANMKMAVFWVVAPYSLVGDYHCFRGTYCIHHQGSHYPDDDGSSYL
jgi:hypothetical protein